MSRHLTGLLLLLLTGCSSFFGGEQLPEDTLADLQPVTLPVEAPEVTQITLVELANIYREVLAATQDSELRLVVARRLADVELLAGEATLADGGEQVDIFGTAIEAYERLLQEYPTHPLNDHVVYQLSKAYEFSGNETRSLALLEQLSSQHPQSALLVEAEFRKAERYFVQARYRQAQRAYSTVISAGEQSPHYRNALYMQGWSLFKQGNYQASVGAFIDTLDQLKPPDNYLESLPRAERELTKDCFRVLAVTFSYLGGASSVTAALEQHGQRSYQHLLYQELGELYLKQRRFRDSADAYKAYIKVFPKSEVAHAFQSRAIMSYERGSFPQLIVGEKQYYVEQFGVGGSYWLQIQGQTRKQIRPVLKQYLGELASYHHNLAQLAAKNNSQQERAKEHYGRAGHYYQQFIDSFPQDPDVADRGFLLAETLYEAKDYMAALSRYEWVAYQFSDYHRAAEAGYAAILCYQQLASEEGVDNSRLLLGRRVESELQFATRFASDKRAASVLSHAAQALFEMGDYQRAITAASLLTGWTPPPGKNIVTDAWLVVAHGHYELKHYSQAEQAYHTVLPALSDNATQKIVVERLAASIYKQGEAHVVAGEFSLAADQFSRVLVVTPQADIRVTAHYDAANNYSLAGDYAQANALLINFRRRYPKHTLSTTIAPKLVANYEQLEQWQAAAEELDGIRQNLAINERKGQALYLAAQYYDRAEQYDNAIARYRSYAHGWVKPVALRMEAMNRLAQIYQLSQQPDKQHYWFNKMIAAHDTAGDEQTERSRYLAASSASALAQEKDQLVANIRLAHPLKKSLRKKMATIETAFSAHSKTMSYGVQQFSTQASYRMAQLYWRLSVDLLNSERPKNLSGLAREQYELLLEEQAYPFEEKAIAIHESNAHLSWQGHYDHWVRKSFAALAKLLPARYAKTEVVVTFVEEVL